MHLPKNCFCNFHLWLSLNWIFHRAKNTYGVWGGMIIQLNKYTHTHTHTHTLPPPISKRCALLDTDYSPDHLILYCDIAADDTVNGAPSKMAVIAKQVDEAASLVFMGDKYDVPMLLPIAEAALCSATPSMHVGEQIDKDEKEDNMDAVKWLTISDRLGMQRLKRKCQFLVADAVASSVTDRQIMIRIASSLDRFIAGGSCIFETLAAAMLCRKDNCRMCCECGQTYRVELEYCQVCGCSKNFPFRFDEKSFQSEIERYAKKRP